MTTLQILPNQPTYIRQNNSTLQYSRDQSSWTKITEFPIKFVNSNAASTPYINANVFFTTPLTLTTQVVNGVQSVPYFSIGSSNITINGKKNLVTISNIKNYLGLIQNNKYYNILIQNINITAVDSTLSYNGQDIGGGWICQSRFFSGGILNCVNNAPINTPYSGGICGSYAGFVGGVACGQLTINNCFNYGQITGQFAGGICGPCAVNVIISRCRNFGEINAFGCGGICGALTCSVNITYSYNMGNMVLEGSGCGGICGAQSGGYGGAAIIHNSYNLGSIASGCGGILGIYCGLDGGAVILRNCYNAGTFITDNSGIYTGSIYNNQIINCYSVNGLGNWNDTFANASLVAFPDSSGIGTIWSRSSTTINTPYILTVLPQKSVSQTPKGARRKKLHNCNKKSNK